MGPTLEKSCMEVEVDVNFTQMLISGMSPYEYCVAGRKGNKSSQKGPTMKIRVFCLNLETALVRDRNRREGGPDRGPERTQPISRKTQHTCMNIFFHSNKRSQIFNTVYLHKTLKLPLWLSQPLQYPTPPSSIEFPRVPWKL